MIKDNELEGKQTPHNTKWEAKQERISQEHTRTYFILSCSDQTSDLM